jgi:hypothetical protein
VRSAHRSDPEPQWIGERAAVGTAHFQNQHDDTEESEASGCGERWVGTPVSLISDSWVAGVRTPTYREVPGPVEP